MPDFSLEKEYGEFVIGVDEVGRGPLAGPVVAAAVYIPRANWGHPVWRDVQDSKKLSSVRRDVLFSVIQGQCQYGIAEASVEEIDELNILQATFLAMKRAIEILISSPPSKPSPAGGEGFYSLPLDGGGLGWGSDDIHILIDGNRLPKNWVWKSRAVIKGDSKSVSIAAASILAKVTRDRMMCELAKENPHFGWENNAGYGTPEHLSALNKHGLTHHHRKTFAPVRDILNAA